MASLLQRESRGRALVAGAADQAVVSFYGLATLIIAARNLAPVELGVFTSALVFYQVLIVVSRALNGEPLVVLAGDGDMGNRSRMLIASVLAALPLSAVGSIAFVLSESVFWRAILICLICAPLIVGYDALRYTLVAELRTQRLCILDALVVTFQILVLSVVLAYGDSVVLALLGISLVYSVPLIFALATARCPRTELFSWYSISKEYGLSFFTESIWGALLQWVLVFAIAHYAGLAEAAAFRSIVVIYGVTNLVTNFLRSTVLSVIVNRGRVTPARAVRDSVLMCAAIALTIGASALVLLSLPDSFGELLLGDTWALAAPYILLGALTRLSAALEAVPGVLLRAARVTWAVVRVRVVVGVVSLAVCSWATWLWNVDGAFYSMTLMSWMLILALSALLIVRLKRDPECEGVM